MVDIYVRFINSIDSINSINPNVIILNDSNKSQFEESNLNVIKIHKNNTI